MLRLKKFSLHTSEDLRLLSNEDLRALANACSGEPSDEVKHLRHRKAWFRMIRCEMRVRGLHDPFSK